MEKPKPRSVISLDVGRKRVGLAGCDPLGITITPLKALRRGSFDQDLEQVRIHCQTRNAKGLIVGIPLDENGMNTIQAKYCEKYGKRLALALNLPIALVNEHSSTWAASHKFQLKKDGTGQLDSAAAALLLDQWLQEGPEPKLV